MKPKISTLRVKCRKLFRKYIRLRDTKDGYGNCITCGKNIHISKAHAGHYIHNKELVYYDERNCHLQCVRCNCFLHGNLIEYTLFMQTAYGQKVIDELKAKSVGVCDWTVLDYIELEKELKVKIHDLEKK